MPNIKPYYMDQTGWTCDNFYNLHRYLHRLLLHSEQKKDEIEKLDIDRMSEKTKVLMYCVISYYHLENLFELPNLNGLTECKPLSEPLTLSERGLKEENVYYRMNVIL